MIRELLPRTNQISNSVAREGIDKCNSHVCMLVRANTHMCVHAKSPNLVIQSLKSKN